MKLLRLYGSYTNLPSVDDYHIKKMGFKGLTLRVLNSNRKYTGSVSIFIQMCPLFFPFFSYNHPGTVNLQCVERHFVTNYLVVLRQFVTTYSCGVQSVCDNLLIECWDSVWQPTPVVLWQCVTAWLTNFYTSGGQQINRSFCTQIWHNKQWCSALILFSLFVELFSFKEDS